MAKFDIPKRTTELRVDIFIQDSSKTDGSGLTGLVFNSAGLTLHYLTEVQVSKTLVTLVTASIGTYTSGGFKEIDATDFPGVYQIGIPNAALIPGAKKVTFFLHGAANMAPVPFEIFLTEERAGKVNDASATTTSFITDLTETANNFWNDQTIQFIDGALEGEAHRIDNYTGSTKTIALSTELSSAPANGDKFRIVPPSGPSRTDIATTVLSQPLSIFNTPGTTGNELRRLGRMFPIEASVNDASPSVITFITDLSETQDDTYNRQFLVFFGGVSKGGTARIVDYNGTTKAVTLDPPLQVAPANGDKFAILPYAGVNRVDINAEAVDAVGVDTIPELAQAQPPTNPTIRQALMLLYMALRNQNTADKSPGNQKIRNDAGTVITKSTLTDDGTIFTNDKFIAGP